MIYGGSIDVHRIVLKDAAPAQRGWDAARTNRLNKAHWSRVTDQPIDYDLSGEQSILRARAQHEGRNNPIVEGVVRTFAEDVAGVNGPSMQVQSESSAFNDDLESLWADVMGAPSADIQAADPDARLDYRGQLRGVDFIPLWVRDLFATGELLGQFVYHEAPPGPLALRLQAIHPRRLGGGYAPYVADAVMGIRQNAGGRPISYLIAKPMRLGGYDVLGSEFDEVPRRDILHDFLHLEAGQSRGVPWLSSSLPSVADLRDYDAQVLDAARAAADTGVYLHTDHVDAEYFELNAEIPFERRTTSTIPPGWKPMQIRSEQPAANYLDYRKEKMADIGRPVGMPGLLVRQDASGHNYSSARFDFQPYIRGLTVVQGWLAARVLTPIVLRILTEARLARLLSGRPKRVSVRYTWPKPAQIDELKHANAVDVRLRNRTMTLSDALAEDGRDVETHIAQMTRDDELLEAAGYARMAQMTPATPGVGMVPPEKEEDEEEKPAPANGRHYAGRV
jgi:lambda family phage portal protein